MTGLFGSGASLLLLSPLLLSSLLLSSCVDTAFNNSRGFATALSIQAFEWEEASSSIVRDDGTVIALDADSPTSIREPEIDLILSNIPADAPVTLHITPDCSDAPVATGTSSMGGTLELNLTTSAFEDGALTFYAGFNEFGAEKRCGFTGASLILDRTPPALNPPANDAVLRSSKSLSWSCDEENCSFRWSVDAAPDTEPTGSWSSTTSTTHASGNGTLYLHLQARDAAGNVSETAHRSFLLDTTPPGAPSSLALQAPVSTPSNDSTRRFGSRESRAATTSDSSPLPRAAWFQ